MWNDLKPDLTKLREFGCHAYALISKEKRSKFDDNSCKCVMVGYMDNYYQLFDLNRYVAISSRNVTFDESLFGIEVDDSFLLMII